MEADVATESVPAPMSPPGTNVRDDFSKSSKGITGERPISSFILSY